jgi:hypothetical protein
LSSAAWEKSPSTGLEQPVAVRSSLRTCGKAAVCVRVPFY